MFKSIVNGAEHDIVSIPMKGKNLFDKSATTVYNAYFNKSGYWILSSDSTSIKVPCLPNTQYTLSVPNDLAVFRIYESADTGIEPSASSSVKAKTITRNANIRLYTFTTSLTANVLLFQGSSAAVEEWFNGLMLNLGTTALPYEPYGYQKGWEVRDNQNRLIWGREDELQTTTGTLPFKGYNLPVKVKSLLGNGKQVEGTTTIPQKSVTVAGIESDTNYAIFSKTDFPNVALGDKVDIIVGGTVHSLVVKKFDVQYVYIENEVV